ncbi:hypothetical protein RHMOL_Rhmol04G0198100 [Rhododendron molle]|uniref:Uncharacterized protein n=1 Tax=Rhododendron molle TaxID=49168 RepID=A0ACC0P2B1_RHOML|nr:hypothetical protein RHMOL_Rhmol04G0198100 [Rhododendron molle]
MQKPLFMRIHDAVLQHDPVNFQQRRDAFQKLGLSSLQKVTAALRMLAYGMAADQCDEYLKIGESTVMKSLKKFCNVVIEIFGSEYLRAPSEEDIQHILAENASRGFPGIVGSTNNDLNVLNNSHLFDRIVSGEAPTCHFVVNGHPYTMGYYLSDGIYPKWATLIQTISHPINAKQKLFAEAQEAVRKDVERAFGVLQARFAIVKGSVRLWHREECGLIMKTCIILHNMIVENEEDPEEWTPPEGETYEPVAFHRDVNLLRRNRISRIKAMTSEVTHSQLKLDLIEHLWNHHRDEQL